MAEAASPQVWKLVLCYDGTPFDGWQVQPGRTTVQGELARAIRRVTGEQTLPQGSGRTDAGVHALAQVASVPLRAPIPPRNLARALNNILPPSIRMLSAAPAAPGFHARHSALRKTYEYRVFQGALCPPWLAPYVYSFTFPIDLHAMQRAAAALLGTHDFASFQAQDPDQATRSPAAGTRTTMRTLLHSAWEQPSPDMLVYRVTGSGFLHHMVRNLVGTMLEVGRGHRSAASMLTILDARARFAAGATAPASGLWLHSVEYPDVPNPAHSQGSEHHSTTAV